MSTDSSSDSGLSRRDLIKGAASGAIIGASAMSTGCATTAPAKAAGVTKGRIKQSVVHWCFANSAEKWTIEDTCKAAVELGCKSVELVGPDDWPTLKAHGLTCAIAPNGMPGAPFIKGLNNMDHQEEVITRTKEVIDAAAENGVPSVIAFNGFKWRDPEDPNSGEISLEEGAANVVNGLKVLGRYAASKGIEVHLEMLNTRDDTHPMKGHPGYQGDDISYCLEIVKRTAMSNVKLLFDIYHVQIMNGDIIRRLKECGDYIGHVHTAGNPGRNELDENQEINYPAVMEALLEIGYTGYVGQEFIPVRDAMTGLRQAVTLCDV
jgi:sugar phosphate isomerase/epimerase